MGFSALVHSITLFVQITWIHILKARTEICSDSFRLRTIAREFNQGKLSTLPHFGQLKLEHQQRSILPARHN